MNKYFLSIRLFKNKERNDIDYFNLIEYDSEEGIFVYQGSDKIGDSKKLRSIISPSAIEITKEQFQEYLNLRFKEITKKTVEEKWPEFLI